MNALRNDNCLAGMKCPRCGNGDELEICGMATFIVIDDGTSEFRDVEWGEDSECSCPECRHTAMVRDFTVESEVGDEQA